MSYFNTFVLFVLVYFPILFSLTLLVCRSVVHEAEHPLREHERP